jgi:Undecaprenyl-phosphate galactose phosphotransferase WbaP
MAPPVSEAATTNPGVVSRFSADTRPFPYLRRAALNAAVMGATEASALMVSLMLGAFIRLLWKGSPMFASWMWYLILAWIIGAFAARLLPGWGLGPVEELRRTVLLLTGVFVGTTAMLFWGQAAEATSRFVLTTGFLFSLCLVPVARVQVKRLLLARNAWGIPTVVYADAESVYRVVEALREQKGIGYFPVGIFSHDCSEADAARCGLPLLGDMEETSSKAVVAVVTAPGLPRAKLAELLEGPLSVYRKILVIPDLLETPTLWVKPRDLVGILGLEISSNLLDPLARAIKRTADLCIVAATAPLWAPLTLLLGFLVWAEDRHSALFLQERVGRDGRRFRAWKFRTMYPDAERILEQKLAEDASLRDEWQNNFKLRRDPRITHVGAFLRRTSLDELPQFVNVLRGEMSLVGPRPLPAYHYAELPDRARKLRDRVRPGITGLWQVSGRSEAGHAAMPKWDTYYVRNWSIWLDIVILVRTIRTVVSGHGAF